METVLIVSSYGVKIAGGPYAIQAMLSGLIRRRCQRGPEP